MSLKSKKIFILNIVLTVLIIAFGALFFTANKDSEIARFDSALLE